MCIWDGSTEQKELRDKDRGLEKEGRQNTRRLTRTWMFSPIVLNDHVGGTLCLHGFVRQDGDGIF